MVVRVDHYAAQTGQLRVAEPWFELTGAAASHALRGNGAGDISTPLVLAAFALASWALRPPNRTLGASSLVTAADRPAPIRLDQAVRRERPTVRSKRSR